MGIYAGNKLIYKPSESAPASPAGKNIRFDHENNFTTEYINCPEGVRQNFIIHRQPVDKPQSINLKLRTNKNGS
ncbi:MAG: hypothetical protein IPO01_13500 [Chitinophagaceae bacterium]|nr:hypothetical protein [Chitinophagaceae bacterium]